MMSAPIPANEAGRLAALARYDIIDTLPEKEFDDIAWLATHICGTPIALITFVDAGRQWFKSRVALDISETARAISFCSHAILGQDLFEVPNALEDVRFRDNPLVTGAPDIRFYAGMPLVTSEGYSLGTLCVIDQAPRHLTPQQREGLIVLARQVMRLLEIRLMTREHQQAQCERDRFFNLSPDLLCIAGPDGYFKHVNPAFSETLGYSTAEMLARPFLDFVYPDDHAATLAEVDKLNRGQRSINFENRYLCKDGSRKLLSWKVHPFVEEGLLYATARDITVQRELEVTLQRRNEELGQSQEELQRANSNLNQLTLALEERVNQRTGQLAEVVEDLRESEARTRLTLDTALDAVVAMNAHGIVKDWNAQAETTFGWKRAEAIGQPMTQLIIPPQYRDAHVRGVKHFMATGEGPVLNRRIEITALHREGREFPVELSITPMKVKGEWMFSAFLRDITERKQVEEQSRYLNRELEQRVAQRTAELVAAREAAELANRAKSTFLATMSHEIRTPMNGMFGMLELLSLTDLGPEQHTKLELVRESGKSLLRIIDDILDFSKIEAEKLELRPEIASVREIIDGVFNTYSGNASSKGVPLMRSVEAQISPAVRVDPLRLRQILNNFVSNALKFTPRGGTIEIKAELMARSQGEERVRFSVTDTGIGISVANQQRLFQPFSQADGDTTRRYGGTGLGLAICRRLAGMMGGSVELVSELGKGTTMILTLSLPVADPNDLPTIDLNSEPRQLGATTRLRRLPPSVEQAAAEGTLVLLVDDHHSNRDLLMRQMHALGYAVTGAHDGVDALDKWQSGRFAIVITDCHMPEMDGYELTRRIRQLEAGSGGKRTPIIACTANALYGEVEICLAAGMDDYLAKPIELSRLLEKLDRWLPIPERTDLPAASD